MSNQPETPRAADEWLLSTAAAATSINDQVQTLLAGTAANQALAQDGPAWLPPETIRLGNEAIDTAAAFVRSCFPNGGIGQALRGSQEWKEVIDLLSLKTLQDQLYVDTRFADVAEFVAEVVRCFKLNPILVTFGAAWIGLTEGDKAACFPEGNEERRKEIRDATVYCYLLHTIAFTVLQERKGTDLPDGETTFAEKVYELFSKERDGMKWKQYFSLFGNAKEKTVDMPMKGKVIPYKSGAKEIDNKASGGALLSVNILEAMMQDTLKFHDDNARCGFELMMESNDRKEIKGAGNGIDREWIDANGRNTGIQLYLCPLPTVWSNLYSSWNMCFCTNYRNYPVFFAKLLNPATFGTYHDIEGLYLAPRVITLYVHLQYVIVTRVAAMSSAPPFGEWRSEKLTLLWGRINKEAARQYQARLEGIIDANYGKVAEVKYDLKRISVRPLWGMLHGIIKAFRSIRVDSKEVDDEGEDVVKLMDELKEKASALL